MWTAYLVVVHVFAAIGVIGIGVAIYDLIRHERAIDYDPNG